MRVSTTAKQRGHRERLPCGCTWFGVIGAAIGFGVAPTLVTLISDALGGGGAIRYGHAATGAITSTLAAIEPTR
ncbi:MAG TPA: hypothetical protein DHW63_09425 [Hyphomonadaceae bacterium]|nr:hypothetical protein [Hyphomonadaceae bacterium]